MGTNQKLLAIVGMAGSGKSEVASLLSKRGLPLVRFGEETDSALQEKGLLLTEENERAYREELRAKLGMAVYAIKALPRIKEALGKENTAVLDGLYSWEEYLYLKEKFAQLMLIAILAEPAIRYARLEVRPKRPLLKREGRQRDIDEIEKLNKGGPIAIADYFIENNGTIEELKRKTEALLQRLHVS